MVNILGYTNVFSSMIIVFWLICGGRGHKALIFCINCHVQIQQQNVLLYVSVVMSRLLFPKSSFRCCNFCVHRLLVVLLIDFVEH